MKSTLSKIFIFAAGAATGSAVTWYFLRTKYEQIVQEEIDSVKVAFSHKEIDISETESLETDSDVIEVHELGDGVEVAVPKVNANIRDYTNKLKESGYVDYSNAEKPVIRKKEVDDVERPYVISPEEFDECGFDIQTLIYYPGGIAKTDYGEIIENIEDIIGIDPEDHFGDYEDDSVFVRDPKNKIDYEILRVEEE